MASIRQARHIEGKLTSVAQRTEVQLRRTGSQTGVRYIHGVTFQEKQVDEKVVAMREEQVPDYPTSFQAEGVTTRCGFSWMMLPSSVACSASGTPIAPMARGSLMPLMVSRGWTP